MCRNLRWIFSVLVVILVGTIVLFAALPRAKNCYNEMNLRQKAKVDAYIQSEAWAPDPVNWVDTSGKECSVYDSATANLSMRYLPDLPVLLAECHYGVVGRIQNAEHTQTGDVCYSLRVSKTFAGYLGFKRNIRVMVNAESTALAENLTTGQEVLLFLSKAGEYYRPLFYEHGVFSISATGQLYAFSNLQSNSVYDGKDLRVLLKDIKRMKKEMDIK